MIGQVTRLAALPFVRFALSGGIAAAINILVRIELSRVVSYSAAIVAAFLAGMTTAFVLMKLYVFEKSERPIGSEYVRFTIVNVIALAQTWAVSLILARTVFPAINFHLHAETAAHIIGVLSPIATSYFLHKYFTFE